MDNPFAWLMSGSIVFSIVVSCCATLLPLGIIGGIGYFITVMIAQMVLGLGASLIVAWFSRYREFRADAGGAALTSPREMAGALDSLRRAQTDADLPDSMTAFGIHGGNLAKLFSSHPPLEERIARLMASPGAR